ncbi:MAG: GAF domain-containing protein, partial [Candidatus Promineofilum sp.]|nr:GAF domain-containing protein [Promineifilum sp.]
MFTFDRDNPVVAAILRHVSDGYCCQLLGPRHHLKSRLVQFAGALLTEFGTHHVVYLDLVAVHPDEQFFTALDAHTRASLSPQLSGPPVDECQSATELQVALVRYALASDRNLLLIIDHLEIAPPNQVASLLSAVRAAHIASMDDYGSRLQVIVCGSMLLSQVALRDADRYERISKTITMQDLSREEGKRLLNAYLNNGLTITADAADAVIDWVDGDALLIREAASLLNRLDGSSRTLIDRDDVSSAIQAFGSQNAYIEEILRHIDNDVRLLMVVRGLLEYVQPSADVLDSPEIRTLLDLCGVIARRNGAYQIKSAAWEHLLRARLSAGYIGRLFARAGDWNRAITYLGQAQSNQTEVDHDFRPELFAAIINAIHDSRDERQTFAVLDAGLRAAYPSPPRDLLLYAVDPDERAFKLITPIERDRSSLQARISLSASDRPEVQACSDTEYSISSVDGVTRLLYPLPSADSGGDPLGLVSADEGTRSSSGYQLWEEREVLLGFLRNVSRTLMSKHRFRDLLGRTSQRVELLRVLDRINTLLHDPELSEETVWRVMLEGVTHGRGLRFNRAVLFTPDTPGQLVANYAVGYAQRATAEADWQLHPFTDEATDDWINGLISRHRHPPRLPGELEGALRGLSVTLNEDESLLKRCFAKRELIHGYPRSGWGYSVLPETLTRAINPADEFVLVPLRGTREPLGVLYVDNKFSGQRISGEEYRILHNFAAQIALVVEGARALASERQLRRLEQMEREQIDRDLQDLQELQRALQFNLDKSGNEPFDDVIRAELGKVCQSAMGSQAWLVRVCPRDSWQIVVCGSAGHYRMWQTPDAPPDPGRANPDYMSPRTVSYIDSVSSGLSAYLRTGSEELVVAPIEVNGNQQATLYVEVLPGLTVTNREKVVERAANRLGVVISQVQNVQVLQRLVDSALRLTRDEPLNKTLRNIVHEAMEVLSGVSVVTLYAIDERDEIMLAAWEGERFRDQMKSHPPYGSTVVENIVKADAGIFATDAIEKRPFRRSQFIKREGIHSVAAFPLTSGRQRLGCMFFSYRRRHLFPDAERSALSLFAQLAAAELLYERLDQELEKKTQLEQYVVRAALASEFIHRMDNTLSGMSDHIDQIEARVGEEPAVRKRLERLRNKGKELVFLGEDLKKRLNEVSRDAKREMQPLKPALAQIVEKLAREVPEHVNVHLVPRQASFSYPIDRPLFEIL